MNVKFKEGSIISIFTDETPCLVLQITTLENSMFGHAAFFVMSLTIGEIFLLSQRPEDVRVISN
jgi:hypothetical protein